MNPIIRELTASPTQPQVITNPIAVPVIRGNASPTIASVVGNTGAIESPARNTITPAAAGPLARSIRKVVMVMASAATSVTWIADTWMRIGETATRPTSNPSANPSDRIFSARFSGMPWAVKCRGSQFQIPTSQLT